MKKKILALACVLCMAFTVLVVGNHVQADFNIDSLKVTERFTYEQVLDKETGFKNEGDQKIVKDYIGFLEDKSYNTTNDAVVTGSDLTNTKTFVNKDFTYQPSIFASLRNVTCSTLDEAREFLLLGYKNGGLDVVNLKDGQTPAKSFTAKEILGDDEKGEILLIAGSDIRGQVYVITDAEVLVISGQN